MYTHNCLDLKLINVSQRLTFELWHNNIDSVTSFIYAYTNELHN